MSYYPHARWSNYVHDTIEHVQEIIESNDTLGGFPGEGNEAGKKILATCVKITQGKH